MTPGPRYRYGRYATTHIASWASGGSVAGALAILTVIYTTTHHTQSSPASSTTCTSLSPQNRPRSAKRTRCRRLPKQKIRWSSSDKLYNQQQSSNSVAGPMSQAFFDVSRRRSFSTTRGTTICHNGCTTPFELFAHPHERDSLSSGLASDAATGPGPSPSVFASHLTRSKSSSRRAHMATAL